MTFTDIFDRYVAPLEPIETDIPSSGSPPFPVKAILFDIYGTLFISASGDIGRLADSRDSRNALSALVSDYKLEISAKNLLQQYRDAIEKEHKRLREQGNPFPEVQSDEIWRHILGMDHPSAAQAFALSFELIINPVYPMPNLAFMLERLKEAGIKPGIVSNAQFYTPLLFAYFSGDRPENLGFDPDLLFYSYRVGQAKPSPLMFGKAREKLAEYGISPESVLFVGNDMQNDIFPARTQGFQTALFAGDRRSLRLRRDIPECRGIDPDMVITDLSQLPAMIGY